MVVEDRGVRLRIWGAALLATLLVLSIGTIVYQKQKLDNTQNIKAEAIAIVEERAGALSDLARIKLAELAVMAGTDAVRSGDPKQVLNYLASEAARRSDYYDRLGLVDASGNLQLTDGHSMRIGPEAGFADVLDGQALVTAPMADPDGDHMLLAMAPYFDERGEPTGAIVSALPLRDLYTRYYGYMIADGQISYLIDQSGRAFRLAEGGSSEIDDSFAADIMKLTASPNGAESFTLAGLEREHHIIHALVPGTSWHMAAIVPSKELLGSASQVKLGLIAALTMIEMLLIALIVIFHKTIIAKLRMLSVRLAQMSHAARHDLLTALPNRVHLKETLNAMIRSNPFAEERQIGVLLIDLDRFKNVNDTLGHNAGDQFLIATAQLLNSGLKEGQQLFRLGGDEFIVLLDALPNAETGVAEAHRLLDMLKSPVFLRGHEFLVTGSAGISFYPLHSKTGTDLLRNADLAMYRAKQNGGGAVVCYDSSMVEKTTREVQIEQYLRKAIPNGELALVYQPIQSIEEGKSGLSAEVLLRWHSKELGSVRPDLFIPIAESTGLIVEIGEWVLRQACTQLGLWRRNGIQIRRISVNMSVIQVSQPDFITKVKAILEETGCDPKALMLEMTESSVISRMDTIADTLTELANMGITIALDDFGTGYSSLSVLHQLDIHVLKIDRSFISRIREGGKDEALVKVILSIARLLGLESVAEGVETEEQLSLLRKLECGHAQGYLLSKPLGLTELERYMAQLPRSGMA